MTEADHWPAPADAKRAALGWAHWTERAVGHDDAALAAACRAIRDAPDHPAHAMLDAVFGGSPHLTQLALNHPDIIVAFSGPDADRLFRREIDTAAEALRTTADRTVLSQGLRRMKQRAALVTALADIGGGWSMAHACLALSEIAETALRLACRHLLRAAAARGAISLADPDNPEHGSGLIVLAMGKLGAGELNYSSDIDLVVLFDDGRITASDRDQIPRTFLRLTRDLVTIMEERTAFGYVFRTDLRLRPDPGATPLAVSVAAAELYYGSMAQTWERAAMIKARPVAGDPLAGAAFAAFLGRFVWRRDLDFAAIEDIHAIKRQIHQHRGHKTIAVDGHDIKLGRGGIREIEFFAQTQQLIFGGRSPSLRSARTVDALAALRDMGKLSADACARLVGAYWALRRVEHRVQMVDDRQQTALPSDPQAVDGLATFLGFPDAQTFRGHVLRVLSTVEALYTRLFEDRPGSGNGNGSDDSTGMAGLVGPLNADRDPGTVAALTTMGFAAPDQVIDTARVWLSGRYRATRSPRAQRLMQDLLPLLAAAFGRTAMPDLAWRRMDDFLSQLPAGVQLFSMFAANPRLLDLVATILGTSDRLADHLARNPAQLDAVLDPGFFEPLPGLDTLAADLADRLDMAAAPAATATAPAPGTGAAVQYEDMLDALRAWTNDQRFRAGIQVLLGLSDPAADGARFLTAAAEAALAALADRVQAAFEARHGDFGGRRLAIVALGKLGSQEMSIRSDLDLIMIYDPPDDPLTESNGDKPLAAGLYHQRLIQRMISAITTQTRNGTLYEVDMRLRPSGRAGPLATSLPAFARYQAEDAWTWEHQALTRARVIYGPPDLAARIAAVMHDAIAKPRDPDALRRDVAEMRARIDREHGNQPIWEVKYARGGLIDIEFTAQFLQLKAAAAGTVVAGCDTGTALARLADAGHLASEALADLTDALTLWRRIQAYVRLTLDGVFDPDAAPRPLLEGLAACAVPGADPPLDRAALETHMADAAAKAYGWFQTIIGPPPD